LIGFFIIKPRHTDELKKRQIWVEKTAMGACTLVMMLIQLPSAHHNPSCDGSIRMLKRIEREKRVWLTKRSQRMTERHLYQWFSTFFVLVHTFKFSR